MSNKEKYVNSLAFLIQSRCKSPRSAHDMALEVFDKELGEMKDVKPEDMAEALAFMRMALTSISSILTGGDKLVIDTICDDVQAYLHDQICPVCKAGKSHDDTEDKGAEQPMDTRARLAEVLSQMGLTPLDMGAGRTPEEAMEDLKDKMGKKN